VTEKPVQKGWNKIVVDHIALQISIQDKTSGTKRPEQKGRDKKLRQKGRDKKPGQRGQAKSGK